MSTVVLDVDLAETFKEYVETPGYEKAFVLLRYSGKPVGAVMVDLDDQRLAFFDLLKAIEENDPVRFSLEQAILRGWLLKNFSSEQSEPVSWSVVICTRERPEDLRQCLDSIISSMPDGLPECGEVIVVDNSPTSDSTRILVEQYPVRYLVEERVGLNWARNRGARSAAGEIVIFTDDDVVVDKDWIPSILKPFRNPRVAAVTGLVMPLELETRAQELFEVYGGFSRGFRKRSFDYRNIAPPAAGYVGAGANMALRREYIVDMKLFEAELDAGTAARTGGDAYAFYLILAAGYQIDYNPEALVFHRHRREYEELMETLGNYSVGGFAFLTRCFLLHKDWSALAIALSWIRQDHFRQLARSLVGSLFRQKDALPLDLVIHQFFSIPTGIRAYFTTIEREKEHQPISDEKVETLKGGL